MKKRIIAIFISLVVLTAFVTIGANKLETALCDEEVYQDTIGQMDNYAISASTFGSLELAESYEEDSTSIISCATKKIFALPVQ